MRCTMNTSRCDGFSFVDVPTSAQVRKRIGTKTEYFIAL